jgi:hypothetical protein
VYRRLVRQVANDIRDYIESGLDVAEIVGVGGLPSCGVRITLDQDGAVPLWLESTPQPTHGRPTVTS